MQADGYASKPRPVVIVQNDSIGGSDSVVTCLLTSYDSSDISTRVRVKPAAENGLKKVGYIMTDKIVTVDRKLLGHHCGVAGDDAMKEVDRGLVRMLGLS